MHIPSSGEAALPRSKAAFRDFASKVHEVEADFLAAGRSWNTWSVEQIPVGESVLQVAAVGASVIANGVVPPANKLVFMLQSSSTPHRVYLNGQRAATHGIAILAPGCEFVFANQVPHRWISLSVGLDRLPPSVIDCFDEQIELHAAAAISAEEAQFTELLRVAVRASLSYSSVGNALSSLCPTNVEDELIDSLLAAVAGSKPFRFSRERSNPNYYYAIVRRVLAGLPDDEIVPVDDLCRSIGIKERTLQRAFNKVFRMPPRRYLKLRQLNKVHAALFAARAQGRLVMDILMLHGVTELGRFAAEYRALFGELPSQTMRRSQKLIG